VLEVKGLRRTLSSERAMSLGLSIAGVLFMIISGVALTLMILRPFQSRFETFPFDAPEFITNDPARLSSAKMDWLVSQYGAPVTMFIASIMVSSIGHFLLKAAGAATRETIPYQDAELFTRILTEKNEEALRCPYLAHITFACLYAIAEQIPSVILFVK
jgi:hypothetical protein